MHRLMHNDAPFDADLAMRTTLTIDDALFEKAQALAQPGISASELLKDCVQAYIQLQTARRLAALGGKAPEIVLAPRRRDKRATA
jgi:Bacterial antitoxin of type II TA system, VapB